MRKQIDELDIHNCYIVLAESGTAMLFLGNMWLINHDNVGIISDSITCAAVILFFYEIKLRIFSEEKKRNNDSYNWDSYSFEL